MSRCAFCGAGIESAGQARVFVRNQSEGVLLCLTCWSRAPRNRTYRPSQLPARRVTPLPGGDE